MIAHIRGVLLTKTPGSVVIECAGVGYELAISVTTYTELPDEGASTALYVHTHVREDALLLFGFHARAEKRLFERLISVSGIGPKLAITVLSGISAERLVGAIRSGDHAQLVKIPGIGKKTAERVVLELKDKLDDMDGFTLPDEPARPVTQLGPLGDDVLSALVNLGYPRNTAQKAVETAVKDSANTKDFEALFRAAMAAVR